MRLVAPAWVAPWREGRAYLAGLGVSYAKVRISRTIIQRVYATEIQWKVGGK